MNDKKIEIAIVEDMKEVALELQYVFNQELDLQCKQVYHNAEEAIEFLAKSPVDIVLTDIGLPKADGITVIKTIQDKCPQTQFCMFTVFEDNDKIFKSVKAGAKGYILKNSEIEYILSSIRELHSGGSPMNPEIARKVLDAFMGVVPNDVSKELPLTKREYELLEQLAKGLLYKEIALVLGITIGTVKQHIHKIYGKLQVNNRTEAINKYLNQ